MLIRYKLEWNDLNGHPKKETIGYERMNDRNVPSCFNLFIKIK